MTQTGPLDAVSEKEPIPARKIPLGRLPASRLIQMDACTRCGECLNWCPIYDQDAREAILPRQKILDFLHIVKKQHSLINGILRSERVPDSLKGVMRRIFRHEEITEQMLKSFVQNLYECSTCGQCQVVCPANIDTVNLWENIRELIVSAGYGPLEQQKALIKSVKAYDNPWQQPRQGRVKWARRARKDQLIRDLPPEIKKTRNKVLLFFGCTAVYDTNIREIAIDTVNILDRLGIDYGCLGEGEKCCGSVLLRMGDHEFERIASDNIKILNDLHIETLVTSCAGCYKTLKEDYAKVGRLNFEVLHTVQFLNRLVEQKKLVFRVPVERLVTYHDPCHLGRASGVFDEPRAVMEAIPGLELVEMPRHGAYSRCCGAGGGVKAGFPDLQNKMAQARIREAEATGAQELVSACPFCYAGLQVGVGALNSPIVVRDVTRLVRCSLEQDKPA